MSDKFMCVDCDVWVFREDTYLIAPPPDRRSEYRGGGKVFRMCRKCWDRMIGLAVRSALR